MKSQTTLFSRYAVWVLMLVPFCLNAQDSTDTVVPKPPAKEYAKATFENGALINNETVQTPGKKSLDFIIQHRFGLIEDESDLFGIYAPANIRMGLTYGITSRLSVGVGASKNKMTYDFNAKYVILKQTKQKGVPVSIAYYGNIAKATTADDNFLDTEGDFKNAYKLSYFHELMIARKFNNHLSLQVAGTYSHFNIIDSVYGQHDFYGVSLVGKYKFSPQSSILLDFDYLLNVSDIEEDSRPKPNLGIGYEVSTGSHQFQVFICTGGNIINQDYRVYNQNDFTKGDFLIGFNITRVWGFK